MGKFFEALKRGEASSFFKGEGVYFNRNPYDCRDQLYVSNLIGAFLDMDKGCVSSGEFSMAFSGFIDGLDGRGEDLDHFWMNVTGLYYVLGQTKVVTKIDFFKFDNCLRSAMRFIEATGSVRAECLEDIEMNFPDAELLKHIKR